jgi:DNA-binding HxlR family transcriptional regulator
MVSKNAHDKRTTGNCDAATCISRDVLANLATKWAPLILRQLAHGERRYSELRGAIDGISEKMLAQTLRDLERDGLLTRTSYPVVPPHVVYALTPIGTECAAHVGVLLGWIEHHVSDLRRARSTYDEARLARV